MNIDYERVREIIETASRQYYGRESCRYERVVPPVGRIDDVFRNVCTPASRVLDIGCGNGRTLLRSAGLFAEGVGMDNDPVMLRLAGENLAKEAVANVRFMYGRADNLPFEKESFDFIFSERGPLAWSEVNAFNAVRALRPGGTILVECPGPLANREAGYVFDGMKVPLKDSVHADMLEGLARPLRYHGIDVRFAAAAVEDWVFADFYEWLKYHMSCWDYYADWRLEGWPLPEKLHHGLERFLAATADDQGRVHITQQRMWAGGVKKGSAH